MPDDEKDITKSRDELTAAAFVISDAAELIALAACCGAETHRQAVEALRAFQSGQPVQHTTNEYADLLHDMLAGREIPVPMIPRREGGE